jgi:hypothetical protein
MVVWSRRNSVQKAQDQRYDVLQSSSELGWSNLFAEVRSYGPETKITILLDGSEGTSGCRTGGTSKPRNCSA